MAHYRKSIGALAPTSFFGSIRNFAFARIDIASVVVFRIAFGLVKSKGPQSIFSRAWPRCLRTGSEASRCAFGFDRRSTSVFSTRSFMLDGQPTPEVMVRSYWIFLLRPFSCGVGAACRRFAQ